MKHRVSVQGTTGCLAALLVGVVLAAPAAAADPEFRRIDGRGNNVANPAWGAAGAAFRRISEPYYADAVGQPFVAGRPNVRAISNAVCSQPELAPNPVGASDMLWQWGQFLDHDIDLVPEADPAEDFSVRVPAGDPFFDPFFDGFHRIPLHRSQYEMIGAPAVREQINTITSYIDASNVYGSDLARSEFLRAFDGKGRLRSASGRWLPRNSRHLPNAPTPMDPSFPLAGDVRASEQIGLLAMHTLFLREHNKLARRTRLLERTYKALAGERPEELTDELRYQLARVLVGAEMQSITYNEFLPVLLGHGAMTPYGGYDPSIDATVSNEFATAAYRLGHSLLSPVIERRGRDGRTSGFGHLPLRDAFFDPTRLRDEGGLAPILRGLAWKKAQHLDVMVVDDVRNFLFGIPRSGGLDLASLNMQRARDHGIPPYNVLREAMGLDPAEDFADITSDPAVQDRLESVYRNVDEVDPWVGMLAEDRMGMGLMGELQMAFVTDTFERLRTGDRFWYENILHARLVRWVEKQTLATIIKRNTNVGSEIGEDVFLVP